MPKHRAAGRSQYQQSGSASLETKIEVVRVQLVGLEQKVDEGLAETRRWREDIKEGAASARAELMAVRSELDLAISKHAVEDDGHHAESIRRVERVENQGLEHGKMVVGRLEALERSAVAADAVDKYKRMLLGAVSVAGVSVLLHAIRFFDLAKLLSPR
jgi:hypothetical protein